MSIFLGIILIGCILLVWIGFELWDIHKINTTHEVLSISDDSYITDFSDFDSFLRQQDFPDDWYILRHDIDYIAELDEECLQKAPWYRSIDIQINTTKKFLEIYGGENGFTPRDIPRLPFGVTLSESEVLLLIVILPDNDSSSGEKRTFEAWWDFYKPVKGYKKVRHPRTVELPELVDIHSQLHDPGIYWIALDNGTRTQNIPSSMLDKIQQRHILQFAGVEVIIAMAQFPEWSSYWDGINTPHPVMRDLAYKNQNDGSLMIPYLEHFFVFRKISLNATQLSMTGDKFSSPSVRML